MNIIINPDPQATAPPCSMGKGIATKDEPINTTKTPPPPIKIITTNDPFVVDTPRLNIRSVNLIQHSKLSKTMKGKCLGIPTLLLEDEDAIEKLIDLLESKKTFKNSMKLCFIDFDK
tara:strand:+ start:67 stop:417 length:351 start_codon:yes stop_codon:yes gene_type:complete